MPNWTRVVHHRWLDERDSRRALPDAAAHRIEQAIRESELHHTGEIRVCVEAGLPWSYLRQDLRARDRAVTLFGKLRVWDTEANNGVLIYLLLADRAIEVLADRGLSRTVDPTVWPALIDTLRPALREGRFEDGLAQAIAQVDALLWQHFARSEGDARPNPNELPDAVMRL